LVARPKIVDFEYARGSMKFPGYWVSTGEGRVFLDRATFDETELDPATNWKQAWQNQAAESQVKGYVEFEAALISAATSLARASGLTLSQTDIQQVACFEPVWQSDRCEIKSLSHLLGSNIS
jgi:hypothetical protein